MPTWTGVEIGMDSGIGITLTSKKGESLGGPFVVAGLVPATSFTRARYADFRDGRDKPGHDPLRSYPLAFATVKPF